MTSRYAFPNAWEMADRRLELLELERDPATKRRALAAGVKRGDRCLEAGAGRGSIVRWLAEVVGPAGSVVAVDINTRFLDKLSAANIEVRKLDIVADPLPEGSFDFIHARLLLMHLPERDRVLASLVSALRPGGAILCEEHDVFPILGAATGDYEAAWLAFAHAVETSAGVDPTWVRTVPERLERLGVVDVRTDVDVALFRGASQEAELWRLTWMQSADQVIAAGGTREVIDAGRRMLDDPTAWFYGPAMVGVWGRAPA
jgi:ubiquinone/menaquinone biosynthesis C-methylase UbiE